MSNVNDVVYKCDQRRSQESDNGKAVPITKLSFQHKRYSNKTTRPSYMWHLESVSNKTGNFKWSILICIPTYSNIQKTCLLCLCEKLEIVTYQNQKEPLNNKSEVLSKCRYANKFLLKNYSCNDFSKLVFLSSRKKLIVYIQIYYLM